MIFFPSGLVSDINDKEDVEVWGHDAGEFFPEDLDIDVEKEIHCSSNKSSDKS